MKIGNWVPLEMEVVNGMLDLLDVTSGGVKYMELGAGDGRFMTEAIARGCSNVTGIEIEPDLAAQCQGLGLNVINDDIFNVDLSPYNRFTFWFNLSEYPLQIIALYLKIRNEAKKNARLVMLSDSIRRWRNGVELMDRDYSLPDNVQLAWQPIEKREILGNRFALFMV